MRIDDFIWLNEIIDKLERKHHVTPDEVEEVFEGLAQFRYVSRGRASQDENVYAASGQTEAGRYLIVFFIYKPGNRALIISARDMDMKERKQYG